MLVAARKLYFTNILLCISALAWHILTSVGPEHLNITANNNTFKIKHLYCDPREPYACVRTRETIRVWKISHVHKSLHGEVQRLFTACYKKKKMFKMSVMQNPQIILYLNVRFLGKIIVIFLNTSTAFFFFLGYDLPTAKRQYMNK